MSLQHETTAGTLVLPCLSQERLPVDEPISGNQLMVAGQSEDREALSELYDHYTSNVYGICLRVLRCESKAEDVVSDVFCETRRKSILN